MNAPHDAPYWLDRPGAPRPMPENERPQGIIVPYDALIASWQRSPDQTGGASRARSSRCRIAERSLDRGLCIAPAISMNSPMLRQCAAPFVVRSDNHGQYSGT